ncbi:hypothetical protein LTR41_007762 [Exophiala xenobiotica]|nr:hypothetical protein LTR41_007762 [Exophiala xenobiotica]KAK5415361.1 hypothetical protein LTR06_003411 [Exophiala xenobiotica]KAK5432291.1 hypothetical protein LTR18_011198 [Exophiala xenobiotica]
MSPPNDEEAQRSLANVDVTDLSQRTCVFLHKVLKQVQKDMDTEVDNGGKTRGWKMTEIQTMLHAYVELCKDLKLKKGAIDIPQYDKLSKSVEIESRRTVKDLQVYTISSMTRNTQKICDCQSWLRWATANLAGAAVVVPMIIMVLALPQQRNLDAWPSVVTVVVATSGFATLIAWASSSSHQDLMVAVATYAAVLVVFVGTQTSTG